ncbi:hypothetical protein [Methylomonas albis]|uniref:Calcineurin-like phosphoesterase domain-containing protein n=1 Tax=Methylomonas albis TaxID=1854563 RepID=A0ABR9D5U3_9GAMM|nr:hypothetical protein [Methylomonas albis]MBD9358455.1 hypothetical protein [Methylomonas albis]CAD6881866.1 hypothetical protein [Methylomonas albis]
MTSTQEDLELTLATLQAERSGPVPQNRLCVCISDVHFTDDSAGDQSPEETVWPAFFDDIVRTCDTQTINELVLILDGDVVDMIRSAEWAKSRVYPWQRQHPEFAPCLTRIMNKIVDIHTLGPSESKPAGFFYLLQETAKALRGKGVAVEVLTLLGNHDKEIFTVPEVLKTFYEKCLGQIISELSPAYREWVGRMYFDNEQQFAAPDSVPWLPFYWGDAGLRLFITHGQWRDRDNCLSFKAANTQPGWTTKDGWRAKAWQQLNYQPFTAPCFGDTVASGALSTFIYRSYLALDQYQRQTQPEPDLTRIKRILAELDLYRPTTAAVSRILDETRNKASEAVRDIIEAELYKALCEWLQDDFVLECSPAARRLGLKAARVWLMLTGPFNMFRIQLRLVRGILLLADILEKLLPISVYSEDGASFKNLQAFPTFQDAFLAQGFRLHGEGHTHIPLEAEADINPPPPSKHNNFTYINFGAWRDQVVDKEKSGYRRRGVGRTLYVLSLQQQTPGQYRYYVKDNLSWGDHMDSLG